MKLQRITQRNEVRVEYTGQNMRLRYERPTGNRNQSKSRRTARMRSRTTFLNAQLVPTT